MELDYAFLCERTRTSGKQLNAFGVGYAHIPTTKLPYLQPKLEFVAKVDVLISEMGDKKVELRVIDEDGSLVQEPFVAEVPFVVEPPTPTHNGIDILIGAPPIRFERYGTYGVEFLVDGLILKHIPLHVVDPRIAKPPGPINLR